MPFVNLRMTPRGHSTSLLEGGISAPSSSFGSGQKSRPSAIMPSEYSHGEPEQSRGQFVQLCDGHRGVVRARPRCYASADGAERRKGAPTYFMNLDWQKIFIPEQPLLDGVIRGSFVYLMLFLIFRFLLRRRARGLAMADVLVIVLIADASQNAMGSEYRSVTEGMTLVLTIVGWDVLIDWLSDRVPVLRPFLRPSPLLLIKDGKTLRSNMRHEMITPDELTSELRKQGIDDVAIVKKAYLEADGTVSVVTKDREPRSPGPDDHKAGVD